MRAGEGISVPETQPTSAIETGPQARRSARAHDRLIMKPNPVRVGEAMRAMRRLIADPEDTAEVFRIIHCLSGRSFERLFARVMADPTGRRILEERRSLLAVLAERERLAALPRGTLGHAYAHFMESENLSAGGLEEASLVERTEFYDDRAECLSDRLRDMHDLWHVVSGYGRDLVGEAALLAFTYAQTRNRGVGFIVLMGALNFWREGHRRVLPVIWHGWRRGRRAAFLPAADWEALLGEPLDVVRAKLRIDEPPRYEPIWAATEPAAVVA